MSVFIVMCVQGKKKHKLRPCRRARSRGRETINRNLRKSSTWDTRSCMVCEGPIWSVTAESCVYDRWNNLSNNDTTSGILWRCASVWLCSRSPNLSCSFNVFMCGICVYVCKSVFVRACMHACLQTCISCVHMFLPWVVTKKHIQLESPNKVCF